MRTLYEIIDVLSAGQFPLKEELIALLECEDEEVLSALYDRGRETAQNNFGNEIYLRGLIEFTNICRNDCYYCGLRRSNTCADRYRLDDETIFGCCALGYELGFRTFVLQGGEDGGIPDHEITSLVRMIKEKYPDTAVTLSVGERSRDTYREWFEAGADRYLLRHETASFSLYRKWHPESLKLGNRIRCLYDLKDLGYQVGAGMMVGAPFQTTADLVEDILFMKELNPEMIGMGPFIPHKDTPFRDYPAGSAEMTYKLLAILRLLFPDVLLPATTALGTLVKDGREKGILAGANVIMPNLSPTDVKAKYLLYNGKIATGEEAAENWRKLEKRLEAIGYTASLSRGDSPRFTKKVR